MLGEAISRGYVEEVYGHEEAPDEEGRELVSREGNRSNLPTCAA